VNEPNSLGPAWLLVALSLLADVLGIFSFLGLDANHTAQVTAMIVLGLIALAAATAQLASAIHLSVSLRGAYYQPGILRTKIVGSLVALIVAIALVLGAAVLAFESDDEGSRSHPPKTASEASPSNSSKSKERAGQGSNP
jgi:uncharacterized membrane protein